MCALVRNDMLKAARCQRLQERGAGGYASPPLSLRGAQRRDNPYSLRQHKTKSNTLGNSEKRHEFAQTAANLPGIPAGMRIAAPVCALVRNDMQKTETRLRLQGRGDRQKAGAFLRVQGGAAG